MKKILIPVFLLILSINTLSAQSKSANAYAKSYELESTKDYGKAIGVMENIYSENSYDVNLRLGWLQYMAGDYLKSEKYYKKAISSSVNSIEARLGLVYPLSALQNWNEVLTTYEDILKVDAHNTTANYQIAVIYFIRKDYQKAAKYAEKVYQLYPFDYSANVLLAKSKIKLGDKSGAKRHLNIALNNSPAATEVSDLLKSL